MKNAKKKGKESGQIPWNGLLWGLVVVLSVLLVAWQPLDDVDMLDANGPIVNLAGLLSIYDSIGVYHLMILAMFLLVTIAFARQNHPQHRLIQIGCLLYFLLELLGLWVGASETTTAELLQTFAERMQGQTIDHAIPVRIAYGAASTREVGVTAANLLQHADQRMYARKKAMKQADAAGIVGGHD